VAHHPFTLKVVPTQQTAIQQLISQLIQHHTRLPAEPKICHSVIQISHILLCIFMPSVLWRCCLGSRKGIRPIKNWVVGCWHGYGSGSRCRFAHVPADTIATHYLSPDWFYLPGFTFLEPAHSGGPGQNPRGL